MTSVCNVHANGSREWWLNGQRHRTDGPAVEWPDGTRAWYVNGQLHRTDGPAYEVANGDRSWWLNGQLHRTDGPAREWADGTRKWLLNGHLHRTDGPAVEWADGTRQWWLNGELLTYDQFIVRTKHAFREAVIALLPLELPPYEMLAMLEWAFPVLATPCHHRACIQLIMGMTESRRRIKSNS